VPVRARKGENIRKGEKKKEKRARKANCEL